MGKKPVKRGGSSSSSSSNGNGKAVDDLSNGVGAVKISPRTVTGVLSSHPMSRDIKVDGFSLAANGMQLVADTLVELNYGRRYGLIGLNGCGKTTFLEALAHREIPVPNHIDIFYLDREVEANDLTALDCVVADLEKEVKRIEHAMDEMLATEEGAESEGFAMLQDALEELDPDTATTRAASILHGLGFDKHMQMKKAKDFSGGWRMRIALARALFVKPMMLLLDEPTNHLDMEACVWLEDYLKTYNRILVLISHSQDFLNNVCTNIIHMHNKVLKYYSGNFDTFVRVRAEKEENQMKQYAWEQEQMQHMKDYVARFGHGSAKLARQAKSKEKLINKMVEEGMTEKVVADRVLRLSFEDCGKLPPPVLQFNKVTFGYSPDKVLYKDLDFGVDLDSRIALVGPNGAGKSTLLKLITGDNIPLAGMVRRHHHLRIAYYHQHLEQILELDMSPLDWMMKCFPEIKEVEEMRRCIGRFGITGKQQVTPISTLSDGQRCRVVFAWIAMKKPHMLLLDEPTNHLDIETIDALADALNDWDGGMILVSHDFRLINQVAKEIWLCENKTVTPWQGSILDYKKQMRKKLGLDPEM
jgi:ATP-binding cassette subfamily F protein 2